MNQGKLEVVRQEMARVNADILGISELKWTKIGEFNSDDHCICYCGQESLRRNGIAVIVNKSSKCNAQVQPQKRQNDLCLFPRQIIQYHRNPSLYLNHKCRRSWSWRVLWRPKRPSGIKTNKRCPFHQRELECKSRKSRDTWVTAKFGLGVQNEAGQMLTSSVKRTHWS